MKKFLLIAAAMMCFAASFAQIPEDVLRYSYLPAHGSARNMAIGGAMGSLGGDISALYVNPAGLGFYKTREIVLSPGIIFNGNKSDFRGIDTKASKSGFDIGTSGLVIGFNGRNRKMANQAFSIGINQIANFNNVVTYRGTNNQSSYSEQYAEQLSQSGLSINEAINHAPFAYGTAPAINTYLIDTFSNNAGGVNVKGLPEFLLDKGIALQQEKTTITKGGIYELAFGYAANMNDKFYFGGSIGVPIVNYTRNTTFRESDPSGDPNNNFASSEMNDYLTTKGIGVNLKLGIIYKPEGHIRLGLAIHTPTYYTLTDRQTTDITTNTEAYAGIKTARSTDFMEGAEGKTLYTATTPFKTIFSASYVFRETSDTRQQLAFITADVEYVGYSGAGFKADGEYVSPEDQQYYNDLKAVIKQNYRSALNYRLGGELKFNTIMFRLGGAYYSNPYSSNNNNDLKSDRFLASGGIGYRNRGIFIDLTYVQNMTKDFDFPYRLSDKANTYAVQKNNRGNLIMTIGFKL